MSFLLLNKKSPGVYVNEVKSGSAPIVGAGTSTAAVLFDASHFTALHALGVHGLKSLGELTDFTVAAGPTFAPNQPRLVTNFTEFKDRAGGDYRRRLDQARGALDPAWNRLTDEQKKEPANAALAADIAALDAGLTALAAAQNALAAVFAAMYGFFVNGGTRCHVVLHDNLATALDALQTLDDVSIVIAPGLVAPPPPANKSDANAADTRAFDAASGALAKIVAHCATMGDRMAILDGPAGTDVHDFAAIPPTPANSTHAAYYYPWIRATNPLGLQSVPVGPSAHIAGVWARVDATRGVHKAPANVDILGATDVEAVVSRADQDGMNPLGVNAIRPFDGAIRIYGARTLGGDANGEFKFINVQRTLAYLAKSIDHGIQWVVFEPNTPALWGKLRRNIDAFLHEVWATGALFGNTPEEAWYVRCDEALNPPAARDRGELTVEIGVALAKPAEFVVVNLTQRAAPSP